MFRPLRLSRGTRLSLGGLLVGIVGLVIQWLADPAKFAGAQGAFGIPFPPGILFILAFGVLALATARWWWHPVFAVFIGLWIVVGGTLADKLQPDLASHNPGTVAGNVVMTLGLLLAAVAGVRGMITGRRARRARA